MAIRKTGVDISTGNFPSARGVAEKDLSGVIIKWQGVASLAFQKDCRDLKQIITETDELRLWQKNIGGFTYTSRDEFLRNKVLINYELTERDMAEIVDLLRRGDPDKARD